MITIKLRVGRILADMDFCADVSVDFHMGAIFDVLEFVNRNDRLIFVDALQSDRSPGTVTLMDFSAIAKLPPMPHSIHAVGLEDVLSVAARLYPEKSPTEVAIVGIEIASCDRFCNKLSQPVQDAIPTAITIIKKLLNT